MLNIRMSRTPVEGSPVPKVVYLNFVLTARNSDGCLRYSVRRFINMLKLEGETESRRDRQK